MTTRVTEGAKTGEATALVSRVSRLAASPLNARARVHSLYQIWRKGETARSLLATASLKKEQRIKNNVQWHSALV